MTASIQELFNISDQLAKNLEIPHKIKNLKCIVYRDIIPV